MARKKDIRVKLETEYKDRGKKLEEGIDTLNETWQVRWHYRKSKRKRNNWEKV